MHCPDCLPVWNCTPLFCAKRGKGWRQIENERFPLGEEFFWEPPSNSVIIILLNYILFFSLPGWWRQSSPLPADDREAVLQACDQRHNDLNQRRIATTVFQQPGPELAVEWLRVGSPIALTWSNWSPDWISVDWLNFREALLLEEPMCLIENIPKKEACLDFNYVWGIWCANEFRRRRNLCIPNSMWCAFSYHDFFCNENNRVCHFMIRHHFLYELTRLVGEDVL